jgi:hypothetical protein
MNKRDSSYISVLQTVRAWPAHQRRLLIEELQESLKRENESIQPADTLSLALGLLATDKPAPTDEEIEQWLEEHRMEKYG